MQGKARSELSPNIISFQKCIWKKRKLKLSMKYDTSFPQAVNSSYTLNSIASKCLQNGWYMNVVHRRSLQFRSPKFQITLINCCVSSIKLAFGNYFPFKNKSCLPRSNWTVTGQRKLHNHLCRSVYGNSFYIEVLFNQPQCLPTLL